MKILFVIKALSLPGGGAERVLLDVAGALTQRHDVTIATFDPADAGSFYPVPAGIRLRQLGSGDVRIGTELSTFLARVKLLRRILAQVEPAVAVGFMHSSYVPLAIAAIATRVPVVASEHTVTQHYRGRTLQYLALRTTSAALTLYTAITEDMRAGFPASIRKKMVVIPNPVASFDRTTEAAVGDDRVLLSVGRLDAHKDHSTLISAFHILAPHHPQWRLRIVGDGELRAALERQVADLGLQGRVQLTGHSADVAKEYATADLFVMPSRYESFGLATAEALAAGVPAIGFADCPGTNELIKSGLNGLLVEGRDRAAALAAGLDRLMASAADRRRMAKAAPISVSQYSLASVVSRWHATLERAASER